MTRRRELFYWAAILFTFSLGTALVTLAYFVFKRGPILAFWIAYILTRPFGASFGDLLSQPKSNGGLGLRTVGTSVLFLVVITVLIVYMTAAQRRASAAMPLTAGMQRE